MSNRFRYIFVGFVLTFLSAWIGLVLIPVWGLGNFEQTADEKTGELIPPAFTALEKRGRDVYIANGCVYCHSQQVHSERARTDISRGWGQRRTIARDYMMHDIAQLGTMRTGPDLANIGVRNPSENWQLLHLYDPQITSPGSIMPPFRFLFDTKAVIEGAPSSDAISLPEEMAPPEGFEVVPSDDVLALVAYLQSLKLSTYEVPGADAARIDSEIE